MIRAMLSKGIKKQYQIIPLNYHLLMFPKRNFDNSTLCGISCKSFKNIHTWFNKTVNGGEPMPHSCITQVISG